MKRILLIIIILFSLNSIEVIAQQDVYWRSDASTSNWWDGNNPWYRTCDGWWLARVDYNTCSEITTIGGNYVHFDNNNQTVMTINGAWFKIQTLTFEVAASSVRTLTSDVSGGLSSVGSPSVFTNLSTVNHVFNTGIGIDGASLSINALNGSFTFNNPIFLNANNITFQGVYTITVNDVLSGTGSLIKEGSSSLILTDINTYSGSTTVSAGTLELQGSIASSAVTVNSGATLKINGTDVTVASLTVVEGGVVNIEAGKSLTVTGALSNSGTLTIKSDASGTGSLKHNSASVSATMQRYMTGTSESWHLISSPVASQSITGDWTPSGGYPDLTGYDFYAYDEPTATWFNQKVGGNNITTFSAAKGYLVSYQAVNPTKEFSGNLNNGDVAISVSKTGTGDYSGANLIGNPYPSGIDWNSAVRTLFADNFAYLYDQTYGSGAGGYITVDGSTAGAYIAPNQGFSVIVAAATTGADFTFTNSMRTHNGSFTKQVGSNDQISLKLSGDVYFDETVIRTSENAEYIRDRNDALKMFSFNANAPQLFSISTDNVNLSINTIPVVEENNSLGMGIIIPQDGDYKLSLETVSGIFSDKVIILEDHLSGIEYNLSQNEIYEFNAISGNDNTRFTLHFGPVGINDQPTTPAIQAYVYGQQLKVLGDGGVTQLEIFDVQGRLLSSETINVTNGYSKTLNLQAGMYVVRLQNGAGVSSTKVIIN